MSNARHLIRQTLTVARRDFIATVFTPTFLIFLFAPILMMSFGLIGGIGAASMSDTSLNKERIIALVSAEDGRALIAADRDLRPIFRRADAPPQLSIEAPSADPAAQARALFDLKSVEASAVLYGSLERPKILYGNGEARRANYLARLAEESLRDARAPGRMSVATKEPVQRAVATASGHGQAAFVTVFGIFFLTLLLAGQAVGTMAEERSNKVIEVLAAAVPLESVFLGKLIGMFGVAVLFVAFWATILTNLGNFLPGNIARGLADIGPAVGMPAFPLLFFAYFTMSYMLQGAVFLSVGAQASTPREIQLLSLPITIFQVAMFGWAQAAASHPDGWVARTAEIFPFSSPLAMGARAANLPEIWPHLIALGWQALWVGITIWIGARLFRRGVLQSGSPKLFKRRAAIDMSVS
jgi:ABC-2 type transport system permease protein